MQISRVLIVGSIQCDCVYPEMLPTHVFADVVQWFSYYDLDALFLAVVHCTDIARLAASKIRISDFSEFRFPRLPLPDNHL